MNKQRLQCLSASWYSLNPNWSSLIFLISQEETFLIEYRNHAYVWLKQLCVDWWLIFRIPSTTPWYQIINYVFIAGTNSIYLPTILISQIAAWRVIEIFLVKNYVEMRWCTNPQIEQFDLDSGVFKAILIRIMKGIPTGRLLLLWHDA